MSTKQSAKAVQQRILRSLKAPEFVFKYQHDSKAAIRQLERKLEPSVSAAKYGECLNNYSTMILYEWSHQADSVINRDYFWRKFADAQQNTASVGESVPSIYLADDINHDGLTRSLGLNILRHGSRYRCSFQKDLKAPVLNEIIKATAQNSDKLKLHSIALRIHSHNDKAINSFVSSLQPLLEESTTMYQDIHYEKLLQIAKKARSGNAVRDLLTRLADAGLSSPKLARNNSWLLFTTSEESERNQNKLRA